MFALFANTAVMGGVIGGSVAGPPGAVVGAVIGLAVLGIAAIIVYNSKADEVPDTTDEPTKECPVKDAEKEKPPEIARQKQDGHIKGTPQNKNREKVGKPTSTFDDPATADELTQEAWQKGTPVPGRPGVKDFDAGRPIGTAPNGGKQSTVRVHQDSSGRIHGHPSGPTTPAP